MNDLNCSKIINESPRVLSWNDDIFLTHYRQAAEVVKSTMLVHMNHIGIVLEGQKEILGHNSKTVVPAGAGFFLKKGAYLVTDRIYDFDKGYEAIVIFLSDAWLRAQVEAISGCTNGGDALKPAPNAGNIALLSEDALMKDFALQLKFALSQHTDTERMSALLPVKMRELLQILITAPGGKYFEMQMRSFDTVINPDLVLLMENNYQDNISLEQYAFLANSSLSTFKRKFQQTFKINPGKWIMQRRLEEAYRLLAGSDKNVTEIAYEVGFETPAHFIASFKQKYGDTPKQLKQKL